MQILPYNETYRQQLLTIWEQSVLATHHFLHPHDFEHIKSLVQEMNFHDFNVFCALDGQVVAGFIGLTGTKIEMLFLSPAYFGKGLGKQLAQFVIDTCKANEVDVNEQNEGAAAFYRKLGFAVYERTDKDDQGNPYPLLRMRLANME